VHVASFTIVAKLIVSDDKGQSNSIHVAELSLYIDIGQRLGVVALNQQTGANM